MRKAFRAWLAGAAGLAMVSTGCAKIQSCAVSPVEIEELRVDISAVDKSLADVRKHEQALTDELATKQADLKSKQEKPAELRRQLELLKRGSGRTEKKASSDKKESS